MAESRGKIMRLLILTQKVDRNDDVLGFMHGWINEFAKKCEKITVICLKKGEVSLPANVKVLSLGKETVESRVKYLVNFYKYIFQERKNYDAVFVHMNPEYVVLGGLFWKLWKKKIALWYVHRAVNLRLRVANALTHKIFTVSPDSIKIVSDKIVALGHGVGTEKFKNLNVQLKAPNSILYLGRISAIKNVDVLIEAAILLDKQNKNFILNIVGEPGEKDKRYFEKIKKLAQSLELKGKIKFLGKIPNYMTPVVYNQNEVLVNLSPSGLFDKTILEAMACERLVLVCNDSFKAVLPKEFIFKESDINDLADKINFVFNLSEEEKKEYGKKFRQYVFENHNLENLIEKIINFLKNGK